MSVKDRPFQTLLLYVLGGHFLLIGWLGVYFPSSSPREAESKAVVVQTVSLKEKPRVSKQPSPAKNPAPEKTAPSKETARAKPPEKPSTPSVKKQGPTDKQKALMAKARETLEKIERNPDKRTPESRQSLTELKILEGMEIDTEEPVSQSYREAVAARLKKGVVLPVKGAVKVELTINRSGKVEKLVVIDSRSDLNKQHVETTLPKLQFPPFGEMIKNKRNQVFKVVLSDED